MSHANTVEMGLDRKRVSAVAAAMLLCALHNDRVMRLTIANFILVSLLVFVRDIQTPLLRQVLADDPQPVPKSTHWWTHVVPAYTDKQFKRNFRINRRVFNAVVAAVEFEPEFLATPNNVGRLTAVSKQVAIAVWRLGRSASVNEA